MNKQMQVPSKALDVFRPLVRGEKSLEYLFLTYMVGLEMMPYYSDDDDEADEGWTVATYPEVIKPLFRSDKVGYLSPTQTFDKLNAHYGFIEKRKTVSNNMPLNIFKLTALGEKFMSTFHTKEYAALPTRKVDVRKEKPVPHIYPDSCFQLKDATGKEAVLAAYDLPTKVKINKDLTIDFMEYLNTLIAIRSGTYTGSTIVRNSTLPLDVVQQTFGSQDLSTEEGKKHDLRRLKRLRSLTVRLLEEASCGGDWCLPQQMEQKEAGRLYAYNNAGFTNTTRSLRKCLLSKYYCFDMDNAQLAILAQLAKDFGEWEHIHYYLDNKSQVRDEMSTTLGISVDEYKQAILSTVFGSSDNGKSMRAIMPSSETRARFRELNADLIRDIRTAKIALVESARAKAEGGVLTNLNDKKIAWDSITATIERGEYRGGQRATTTAEKYRKAAAFLLQGAESRLIREVLSIRGYGNKVVTTIHDSFVTIVPIDLNDLQEYLFNRTGLNVSWSAEHIPEKPCASWAKELKEKKVVPMKPTKKEDRKNG